MCVHDRHGAFAKVRKGLYSLSQLILGGSAPIIAALSAVLCPAVGSPEVRNAGRNG